jgi:hypothetical protein
MAHALIGIAKPLQSVGKLTAKLAAEREQAWLSANMAGASQSHSSASRVIGRKK